MLNKGIFRQTWALYAGGLCLVLLSPNLGEVVNNARWETLSRFTPSLNYFDEFARKTEGFDPEKLDLCIYYHQKIVDFCPRYRTDAYGMLGYCNELKGRHAQAIDSYKRAVKLNSSYFWPYYDLGVIYYNQKNYEQAKQYFQTATEQDPLTGTFVLITSKVYKDVFFSDGGRKFDAIGSLKDGYHKAFLLLVLCCKQLGDYPRMLAASVKAMQNYRWNDPLFLYYAGEASYQLKSYGTALQFMQKYLDIDPNNWQAVQYAGLCMRELGRQQMAETLLARSEQLRSLVGNTFPDFSRQRVQFF